MSELLALQKAMSVRGLLKDAAERQHPGIGDVRVQLNKVLQTMHMVNRFLTIIGRLKATFDMLEFNSAMEPGTIGQASLERAVTPYDAEAKVNDLQAVELHCLQVAYENSYRRFGDWCYKPVTIVDADGSEVVTHAWVEAVAIEDFVYRCCPKETDYAAWRNLTAGHGNAASAAKYLKKSVDPELPPLVKDRHVFAFSNGTYVTWVQPDPQQPPRDLFVPYKLGPNDKPLHRSVVASNYFEGIPMQYYDAATTHWSDIPTPNLDKILDTQRFAPDVKRWLYIFMGRLMYDLKEHDSWGVIPFLKGVGGSGKSTLGNDVCGVFYHKHDTAILSNNIERRFGLSGIVDHNLFLAPEIKEDFAMEQAEFQSIVTGDKIQVNKKNEVARSVDWLIPGILAGNELPGWVDNSGSIARRIVIFQFAVFVPDTELNVKLRREMGAIMQKCSRAYHEAVLKVGSDSVWCHLPNYFHMQQEELRKSTNSLEHFLGNNVCSFGPDHRMPREDFIKRYKEYCQVVGMRPKPFNGDTHHTAFERYGIKVTGKASHPYRGQNINAVWLQGVDILDAEDGQALGGEDGAF